LMNEEPNETTLSFFQATFAAALTKGMPFFRNTSGVGSSSWTQLEEKTYMILLHVGIFLVSVRVSALVTNGTGVDAETRLNETTSG